MERKTISLPGHPDLDIASIQPLIDTDPFQKLRRITQLGLASSVFPVATHTRWSHSLGAYLLARERVTLWLTDGTITETEAATIMMFALLHDIGHGPYSHATEVLCLQDHNEHGFTIIQELKPQIENFGANMNLLEKLWQGKHPLAAAVKQRPAGVDKLDYLIVDSLLTNQSVDFRRGDMINHLHYIDGQMVVDTRFLQPMMQLQHNYENMHEEVYFKKACIIVQYFLQQIVARAIRENDINREKLPTMRDNELDTALSSARDTQVKKHWQRILNRTLPKMAIILRAQESNLHMDHDGKSVAEFRIPLSQLEKFEIFENRDVAACHESAIAKIAGIPDYDVLLTPIASPRRFMPDDIGVCNSKRILGTLREFYPLHYASIQERILGYSAVRICVPEEHRKKVAHSSIAQDIFDYLMDVLLQQAA